MLKFAKCHTLESKMFKKLRYKLPHVSTSCLEAEAITALGHTKFVTVHEWCLALCIAYLQYDI